MPLVLLDVADGVATLTLNNPDERNTLTAPMVAEIIATMDIIEADNTVGAIVVTGTAPAFCAGANLGNLAESTEESLGGDSRNLAENAYWLDPNAVVQTGFGVPTWSSGIGLGTRIACDGNRCSA